MTLKDRAVERVYAIKQRAWREKRERYREAGRHPPVSARVLVRMDAGIGNAVEATPLVQAVRALWPRVHLTIVPPAGDLFADWNVVDAIVRPDELAGKSFDSTFVTWSAEEPGDSPLFTPGEVYRAQGLFPQWQLRPEREVNLDIARKLGFDGLTPPLYVSLREPDDKPPAAARRIAIAPGGKPVHRWRHKRWPHYAELIHKLVVLYPDVQIRLIGNADDEIGGALRDTQRIVDLRGRHTLRETAWILRNSDLVIGNDCGPMHVADAVLARTLVLFGPTCELKNGPRYRGVTLSADAACSPCQYDDALLNSCADPVCMRTLTVDAVLAAARKLLG